MGGGWDGCELCLLAASSLNQDLPESRSLQWLGSVFQPHDRTQSRTARRMGTTSSPAPWSEVTSPCERVPGTCGIWLSLPTNSNSSTPYAGRGLGILCGSKRRELWSLLLLPFLSNTATSKKR